MLILNLHTTSTIHQSGITFIMSDSQTSRSFTHIHTSTALLFPLPNLSQQSPSMHVTRDKNSYCNIFFDPLCTVGGRVGYPQLLQDATTPLSTRIKNCLRISSSGAVNVRQDSNRTNHPSLS